MKPIFFLLLLIFAFVGNTECAICESGWVTYKDQLCIKVFSNFLTYNETRDFCSLQGTETSKASLLIIKTEDIQELVANTTQDINDYLWLGGKYDEATSQFIWEDGEPVNYTNWQEGYPRQINDSDSCIELRPSNAKSNGQWANVVCGKRNLVMCQKPLTWTLEDAVTEIKQLRKDLTTTQDILQVTEDKLQATQANMNGTEASLQETKQDLQTVSSRVVPVGSIYIEYYNQPAPRTIWPNLTWSDITGTYAGIFFRASGGEAASWGSIQSACAPRITQMELSGHPSYGSVRNPLTIPSNGWSEVGYAGVNYASGTLTYEGLKYKTEGCEVRPRNQAIRIWKRTA